MPPYIGQTRVGWRGAAEEEEEQDDEEDVEGATGAFKKGLRRRYSSAANCANSRKRLQIRRGRCGGMNEVQRRGPQLIEIINYKQLMWRIVSNFLLRHWLSQWIWCLPR